MIMTRQCPTPLKTKKRRKKVVSTVLAVSMLCTLAPATVIAAPQTKAPVYSDVTDKAWYKEAVDYVTNEGLLVGVSADKFGPQEKVTRGMVATVMWRQCGAPQNDGTSDFKDVAADKWYAQAIAWGAKEGLVAGYSADTFGPNDPVSRQQLASFIQRMAKKNGQDTSIKDASVLDQFKDAKDVDAWAKDAMIWALENKVIAGTDAGLLAPDANATRAQYAAILMRTGATLSDDIDLANYDKVSYYHNGKIITVDEKVGETKDGQPITAKSVLTGDGYIIAVAYTDEEDAKLQKLLENAKYNDVDLNGQTMIPAFVDAHSHVNSVGRVVDASPSSGVTSLDNLVSEGQKDFDAWVNDHTFDNAYGPIEPGGKFWFVTNGYDNTAFKGGSEKYNLPAYAMPTKEMLDDISTEYPIIYGHASGHLGVVNSLGLELIQKAIKEKGLESYAKIDVNWSKDANGEYTGLLNEEGYFVISQLGFKTAQSMRTTDDAGTLENAMDIYASNGIATAISADGGADKTELLKAIPEDERILDVNNLVGYAMRDEDWAFKNQTSAQSKYNEYGVKNSGVKLFLDGSPQGKNAWFAVDENDPSGGGYYRSPNETLLDNKTPESQWWWGEKEGKKVSNEQLTEQFTDMMKKGIQFHAHANGTGAIQQYIDCYRQALVNCGVDLNDKEAIAAMQNKIRPVIIHTQTVTQKQLKEIEALGLNPSFFTDHVYYYGDYHMYSTVGPVRGQIISPMADALAKGNNMNVTMHQDSPVSPPNMLFSIFNAANRITRDGQPIGRGSADGSSNNDNRITDWTNSQYDLRDERVSAYEAMKCITINSAWQGFEEDQKGSISVGKQADFAILEVDPLSNAFLNMDPAKVQQGGLVLETINNDKVIFQK